MRRIAIFLALALALAAGGALAADDGMLLGIGSKIAGGGGGGGTSSFPPIDSIGADIGVVSPGGSGFPGGGGGASSGTVIVSITTDIATITPSNEAM